LAEPLREPLRLAAEEERSRSEGAIVKSLTRRL
jgi:hypothetical protein